MQSTEESQESSDVLGRVPTADVLRDRLWNLTRETRLVRSLLRVAERIDRKRNDSSEGARR